MIDPRQQPWWRGVRGEWYVIGQVVLMVLVFFGPRHSTWLPPWPDAMHRPAAIVGIVLLALGLALLLGGVSRLGPNLTPMPRPKADGVLLRTGAFGVVRHPMYGGGLDMAIGWALIVHGWLTLLYAVALTAFLDVKASREEQWLREKYPEYPEYAGHVRKLIPFVY